MITTIQEPRESAKAECVSKALAKKIGVGEIDTMAVGLLNLFHNGTLRDKLNIEFILWHSWATTISHHPKVKKNISRDEDVRMIESKAKKVQYDLSDYSEWDDHQNIYDWGYRFAFLLKSSARIIQNTVGCLGVFSTKEKNVIFSLYSKTSLFISFKDGIKVKSGELSLSAIPRWRHWVENHEPITHITHRQFCQLRNSEKNPELIRKIVNNHLSTT